MAGKITDLLSDAPASAVNLTDVFEVTQDPSGTPASAAATVDQLADLLAPRFAQVSFYWAPNAASAGMVVPGGSIAVSTSYPMGGARASGGAQNEYIEYQIPLAAGTYKFQLMHNTQTDCGIYTLSVDGVDIGTTIDGYPGSSAYLLSEISGITVTGSGRHAIRLRMASKNASSAAYRFRAGAMSWTRTGA